MKKLLKGIAAAGLSLSMLTGTNLPLFAEEADAHRTTDGIQVETVQLPSDPNATPYTVNFDIDITIPADFPKQIICINPAELTEDVVVQPGDMLNTIVKIKNESDVTYHYADKSLDVYSLEQNLNDPRELVYRPINQTLIDLGVDENAGSADLSDEKIGALLKAKNYGLSGQTDAEICVNYLDDYYLDYYNDSNNNLTTEPVESLMDVSLDYRGLLFNTPSYKNFDNQWVNPIHRIWNDAISAAKETNEEVNRLSHYHAYKDMIFMNGFGFTDFTDHSSEAYKTLNSTLNTDLFSENGIAFKTLFAGGMGNAYQDHVFYMDYCFYIVPDGLEVEDKISEPDLVKKITDGDKIIIADGDRAGDYATVDANGKVNFTLTSHVGEDLAEVITPKDVVDPGTDLSETPLEMFDTTGTYTFTFVDNLDGELTLDQDSIAVAVNGKTVELPAQSITVVPLTEGDYAGRNQIRVTFDLVDLFKKGYFTYAEFGTAPIVMTYSATVKDPENVIPGKMYNTAWVEYRDKETEPDEVEVDTFGVKVLKYDQTTNNGLQGAKFDLYYVNGEEKTLVKKDAETGADGYVIFKGLKEGQYKLVETKAPTGYVKSEKALQITVNGNDTVIDDTYYVNTQFANAPKVHTGGSGTMLFSLGGGVLLMAGAAYYLISKKRQAA